VSARETLEQRALRYIAERRLHVVLVDSERVEARVQGATAEHLVTYQRGGWTCTCDAHRWGRRCTHLHAVQLVCRRPERQHAGLTAERFREAQREATAVRNGRRSA
jgi:hypothetical protein